MPGPRRSIHTWGHSSHSLLSNLCLIGCRRQLQPERQQGACWPGAGETNLSLTLFSSTLLLAPAHLKSCCLLCSLFLRPQGSEAGPAASLCPEGWLAEAKQNQSDNLEVNIDASQGRLRKGASVPWWFLLRVNCKQKWEVSNTTTASLPGGF